MVLKFFEYLSYIKIKKIWALLWVPAWKKVYSPQRSVHPTLHAIISLNRNHFLSVSSCTILAGPLLYLGINEYLQKNIEIILTSDYSDLHHSLWFHFFFLAVKQYLQNENKMSILPKLVAFALLAAAAAACSDPLGNIDGKILYFAWWYFYSENREWRKSEMYSFVQL